MSLGDCVLFCFVLFYFIFNLLYLFFSVSQPRICSDIMQHWLFIIYLFIYTNFLYHNYLANYYIHLMYILYVYCWLLCITCTEQTNIRRVFYPDNISQQGHSLSETIKFSDHCRYIIYRWFTPKTLQIYDTQNAIFWYLWESK